VSNHGNSGLGHPLVSWYDWWKMMSPQLDPLGLVGPRLNNTVLWLVDGGLGTFHCVWRTLLSMCVYNSLTPCLFERKWSHSFHSQIEMVCIFFMLWCGPHSFILSRSVLVLFLHLITWRCTDWLLLCSI